MEQKYSLLDKVKLWADSAPKAQLGTFDAKGVLGYIQKELEAQQANPLREMLDQHHLGNRYVVEEVGKPGQRLYFKTPAAVEAYRTQPYPVYMHLREVIAEVAINRTAQTCVQDLDPIKPECLVGLTVQDLVVLGKAVDTYRRIA